MFSIFIISNAFIILIFVNYNYIYIYNIQSFIFKKALRIFTKRDEYILLDEWKNDLAKSRLWENWFMSSDENRRVFESTSGKINYGVFWQVAVQRNSTRYVYATTIVQYRNQRIEHQKLSQVTSQAHKSNDYVNRTRLGFTAPCLISILLINCWNDRENITRRKRKP